ncbi:hypothetical protein H0H92_012600, partial [Tricholoma furcatifolium]
VFQRDCSARPSVVDHGLPLGGLALGLLKIEHVPEIWAEGEKKEDSVNSKHDRSLNKKCIQNTPSFDGEEWVKATAAT